MINFIEIMYSWKCQTQNCLTYFLCAWLQEKETAKSMLRGMRTAQSSRPPMDLEHFPPWFLAITRSKLKSLWNSCTCFVFNLEGTIKLWNTWDMSSYSVMLLLVFCDSETIGMLFLCLFVCLLGRIDKYKGRKFQPEYVAVILSLQECSSKTHISQPLVLYFDITTERCDWNSV